jgi:hypothetical protein
MFIVRPKPSLRGALIKVAYRWLLVSMLGAHHPKGGHFFTKLFAFLSKSIKVTGRNADCSSFNVRLSFIAIGAASQEASDCHSHGRISV